MLSSGKSYASGGMARAALWLLHCMGSSLKELYESNCDIIVSGHSLGKLSWDIVDRVYARCEHSSCSPNCEHVMSKRFLAQTWIWIIVCPVSHTPPLTDSMSATIVSLIEQTLRPQTDQVVAIPPKQTHEVIAWRFVADMLEYLRLLCFAYNLKLNTLMCIQFHIHFVHFKWCTCVRCLSVWVSRKGVCSSFVFNWQIQTNFFCLSFVCYTCMP